MLCEASLCQFIMRACLIYQTPSRHMMMMGSHIQYIQLPAALGTERRMTARVVSPCRSITQPWIENITLASQHHKIRHGYRHWNTGKRQTWQKYNPVAYLVCQMSLDDEEVYCHTIQWKILLIQSYLSCPLHARPITLLKHSMKASLGPSSPCIIHGECLLLQTHWMSRSFSSEPRPRRAGCPTG